MTVSSIKDENIVAESLVACAIEKQVSSERLRAMISSNINEGRSFFEACAMAHQQIQCEHKANFALSKVRQSLSSRKRRLFVDTLLSSKRQLLSSAV